MKKILLFIIPLLSFPLCSCEEEEEVPEYVVTWKYKGGEVLESDEHVKEGTFPEYNGPTPTKEGNYYTSYVFKGWEPELSEVKSNRVYEAVFEEVENKYTVYWKNGNTIMYTLTDMSYGATRTYGGETPTKDPVITDDHYCEYKFSRWSSPVIEGLEITYNAEFSVKKTPLTKKAIMDYLKDKGTGDSYWVSTGSTTLLGYSETSGNFLASCQYSNGTYSLAAVYQCSFGKTEAWGTFRLRKNGLLVYECTVDIKTSNHLYSSASIREVETNQCTDAELPSINNMIVTSIQGSINNCTSFLLSHNFSYIF